MARELWSLIAENRERVSCGLALVLLALAVADMVRGWRGEGRRGPPTVARPAMEPLPEARWPDARLAAVWRPERRDPFQPPGPRVVAGGPGALRFPPLPPVRVVEPPPPDPSASLYRGGVVRGRAHLLFESVAAPKLKTERPCTIRPRPHDIVQAPGDPKPIEGKVLRDRDGKVAVEDGTVRFYTLKGVGHPGNPLRIADLKVYKLKAPTVRDVLAERSREAGKGADAHFALAKECINGDLPAEAEAELKKTIELDPRHRAACLKLADLYAAQGECNAEVGVCRAAVEGDPHFAEAHSRLGWRCLELGLFGLAQDHLDRAVAAVAKASVAQLAAGKAPLPDAPLARRIVRQAAEVWLLRGRRDEALSLLARLATAAPGDPAVANARAVGHILAGRGSEALALLRPLGPAAEADLAAKLPPSVLNNLGALLLSKGERESARKLFVACLAALPGHRKATANAAAADAAAGRLDESRKRLASLAEPGWLACQLVLGYIAERQGDSDGGQRAYQAALGVDRACVYALCGRGRCLLATGQAEAAAECFAQALLVEEDHPEALRGLGTCRYRGGRFVEAARAFEPLTKAAEVWPDDLARFGAAAAALEARRGEAVTCLERAVKAADPPSPYALAAMGFLAHTGAPGTTPAQAEALFLKARAAKHAPEVSQYAAAALARILAAREEVLTVIEFKDQGGTELPQGWRQVGYGTPRPVIRGNALRFEAQAKTTNVRQVVRAERLRRRAVQADTVRALARFEASAHVPYTNQAAVGVVLNLGKVSLQVVLRTRLRPRASRRLAYRLVRGKEAGPWVDLPRTVAREDFRLGLAFEPREPAALTVLLDGRPVGRAIALRELGEGPETVEIGLLAVVAPREECLYAVRDVAIAWRKARGPDQ